MKILAVTDIHGQFSDLSPLLEERFELVLIAGDITNFGSLGEAKEILREYTQIAPVLFVPGNCDPTSLLSVDQVGEAEMIHGRGIEIKGLRFAGLGGATISPFNTYIEFTEDQIKEALKGIGEVDVMISHSPPFGVRDQALSGLNIGSKALRKFILERKPVVVVVGHIHEARGYEKLGETIIVNPGQAARGNYLYLELENKEIKRFELKSFK